MEKKNIALALLALIALPLAGCGGDSSASSSEELFASNVSETFFLSEDLDPYEAFPESETLPSLVFFDGFETYEALEEKVESLLTENQLATISDGMGEIAEYMSSSDDYIFLVWQIFMTGNAGRWFDFYDNTLTSHQAYDCYVTFWVRYTFDVVIVPRDIVDDFDSVAFAAQEHSVCTASIG